MIGSRGKVSTLPVKFTERQVWVVQSIPQPALTLPAGLGNFLWLAFLLGEGERAEHAVPSSQPVGKKRLAWARSKKRLGDTSGSYQNSQVGKSIGVSVRCTTRGWSFQAAQAVERNSFTFQLFSNCGFG